MGKYDGMTVNEWLFDAGLLEEFDRARASGELANVNAILAQVDLRQDEQGMQWSLTPKEVQK